MTLGAEGEEALANNGWVKTRRHDKKTNQKERGFTHLGPWTRSPPSVGGGSEPDGGGGCGGDGPDGCGGGRLTRLCTPWACEPVSSAPPAAL
jgi:hypothetical protein